MFSDIGDGYRIYQAFYYPTKTGQFPNLEQIETWTGCNSVWLTDCKKTPGAGQLIAQLDDICHLYFYIDHPVGSRNPI